ncbi:hypothetical protein SAMD00019534_040070 [Acytostelium subglobosum LB1]|uniref:hypothetical protein n=1 Tax=Acytostelium subglobosum LB1 TaxID=1410327 RepID=UPI000644C289|nr:hypothetical protein SAMD00019534_040070 [Acytostelium subglobosum LB1]GAM20832.1 hypothetical protein SAMD00019534_040070 [Acytostelium subglobosum LB1]|eukprot:XP_012755966.1 hypothetical protein SAMD00019534_040070 [Acytostelium subglobosum LB1]
MFNGHQHVKFGNQVAVQTAPFFWDAGVIDSNNQILPWNTTFSCAPMPATLSVSMYSGPFVRNSLFPSQYLQPPRTDIFQTTVSITDPFNGMMFDGYACKATIYVCQLVLLRQGPNGPAVSSLYQVLLYPIGTDEGDYTQPINLTITNSGRTAYVIFPPLTVNTVRKSQSSTVYDMSLETGLVPNRPNSMFGASVSSTSLDALYFIYSNVSSPNQLLSYFRVFKPVRTYPNGYVDNLALATIQMQQTQIFEATTSPGPFGPYIRTPYQAYNSPVTTTQVTYWTDGSQFGSTFLLPNYRTCTYGYQMALVGPDDRFSYPFGVKNIVNGGNTTMSVTFYINGYVPNNLGSLLYCTYVNVAVLLPALHNQTDETPPIVESFQIVPLGGTRFLLRTTVSDAESGFQRMMLYFSTGDLFIWTCIKAIQTKAIMRSYLN